MLLIDVRRIVPAANAAAATCGHIAVQDDWNGEQRAGADVARPVVSNGPVSTPTAVPAQYVVHVASTHGSESVWPQLSLVVRPTATAGRPRTAGQQRQQPRSDATGSQSRARTRTPASAATHGTTDTISWISNRCVSFVSFVVVAAVVV